MEWLELAARLLGRPTQLPIRLLAPFRSLVLMSEGFTLDETIRCLTTEGRIAIPAFIRTPSEKIAIPAV